MQLFCAQRGASALVDRVEEAVRCDASQVDAELRRLQQAHAIVTPLLHHLNLEVI
jgi:hypothetical protein